MVDKTDGILSENSKTEQDLVNILNEYPGVSIIEERLGDTFIVREKDESRGIEHSLYVFLGMNFESRIINPKISYQIPETEKFVYLEFTEEGLELSGAEYEDIDGLMELARAGIKIMLTYKGIPIEERHRIESKYWGRVYDGRQAGDPPQLTNDCLERTLEGINAELGE
jgi:hypothetical protein